MSQLRGVIGPSEHMDIVLHVFRLRHADVVTTGWVERHYTPHLVYGCTKSDT